MAYKIRFPASVARGLEETWRADLDAGFLPGSDFFSIHDGICRDHEPLSRVLDFYVKPGQAILEAGCGEGRWVHYLKGKGYRAFGADLSRGALSLAKGNDPGMCLVSGDVCTLPFASRAFDAVISSYVLEHFPEGPGIPLQETYRVLKPGGRLFFIVPYNNVFRVLISNRLLALASYYYASLFDPLTFVEYRYSRKECERILQEAGFTQLRFFPDEYQNGWNKGIAVDYGNLKFYWSFLPDLPERYRLPRWMQKIHGILSRMTPWLTCGGVICVVQKPVETEI